MIIVKTSNGDHFVNEAEVLQVAHDKAKAQVVIWPRSWCNPTFVTDHFAIEDVESVIYTNADQTVKYEIKGSKLEELEARNSELYEHGNIMRTELLKTQCERDRLEAELEELKNRFQTADVLLDDKKSPLTFHAISPILGDCTQSFNVEGCDKMSTHDFIMDVIGRDQFVSIYFKQDGYPIWSCHYSNQKLDEGKEDMPGSFDQFKVKSAKCNGGWGQMNYDVMLYGPGE